MNALLSLSLPVFKIFFLMWTILKVFIEFVTILLLFHVLFFGLEVHRILAPQAGIEPAPPASKGKVVTSLEHQGSP